MARQPGDQDWGCIPKSLFLAPCLSFWRLNWFAEKGGSLLLGGNRVGSEEGATSRQSKQPLSWARFAWRSFTGWPSGLNLGPYERFPYVWGLFLNKETYAGSAFFSVLFLALSPCGHLASNRSELSTLISWSHDPNWLFQSFSDSALLVKRPPSCSLPPTVGFSPSTWGIGNLPEVAAKFSLILSLAWHVRNFSQGPLLLHEVTAWRIWFHLWMDVKVLFLFRSLFKRVNAPEKCRTLSPYQVTL